MQSGIDSVDDGKMWVTRRAGPALELVVSWSHTTPQDGTVATLVASGSPQVLSSGKQGGCVPNWTLTCMILVAVCCCGPTRRVRSEGWKGPRSALQLALLLRPWVPALIPDSHWQTFVREH